MEGAQRSTFPASLMDGMEFERQPVAVYFFFKLRIWWEVSDEVTGFIYNISYGL